MHLSDGNFAYGLLEHGEQFSKIVLAPWPSVEPSSQPGTDLLNRARLSRHKKWAVAVATVVLIVGLSNIARGALAIVYATRLPALPMTVSWGYVAATAIFWGLVLTACSFVLAGFYPWARWLTLAAATTYEAHVWANHLLFDANDYAGRTWPRDLVLTALLLALVWGVLSWPSVRAEFDGR
jgi:hypothetical protein